MILTESKQVHLLRQMCEHACFVTMSATEIGCLCEHDGLSFLSQRLIVCDCVRESVLVYVQRSVSDQANFTQTLNFGGVLFPDPIRCCQSHKLNTLFILSPTLPCLSYSLCLCLTLIPLLHYSSSFFLSTATIFPWSERDI